jgi:Tol biopolymer transport system component
MEFVEGEDLAARLRRGAIPIDEAIAIAKQIAEGLEEAHEKGIVHRDLKPANVKLTPDGKVKVLDFGLAKAFESTGAGNAPDLSHSPTISRHMTEAGMIMGTAAYMSPEQARGKPVDKRGDIWSFGVLLFEILSGTRLFAGETVSDTLASVLRQDVTWTALPSATPPRLRRLLERCLDRDVKQRLRDIGEARFELEHIGRSDRDVTTKASAMTAPPVTRAHRQIAQGVAAAALLAALALGWWIGRRSHETEPPWSNLTQLTDAAGVESGPTISPDGASFAYSSASRGSWDIYVQRVGGRNPVLVAGDPGRDEVWPAFSPDGRQLAFNQGGGAGGIFVVGATGESVRRLTDFGANPAWSPDGRRIVFSSHEVGSAYARSGAGTLWAVETDGGAPVKLDDGDAVQPSWSPSGKRIAFWQSRQGQRDVATVPAGGGPRVEVTFDVATDWAPVWSPDGQSLYFASDRGGTRGLWRIGIDEATGRPTSEAEPIAQGVDGSIDLPRPFADGRSLVFRSMIEAVNPAAIAFDPVTGRAGAVTLLQRRTGILVPQDRSSDGEWLALSNRGERQEDIFVMRAGGTELSRLTDDAARERFPFFSPDGGTLTFFSNKSGSYQGHSIRRDGGDRTQLTDFPDREASYTSISPNGRRVLVATYAGDFLISPHPGPVTLQGGTLTKWPRVGAGHFVASTWSRDGRWLTGRVQTASGAFAGNAIYDLERSTVRQLSEDGGPVDWMPDHRRVVYFTSGGKLMIQDIESATRREIDVKLPLPPEPEFQVVTSPDGRTIYYGARETEANIWKVERLTAVKPVP